VGDQQARTELLGALLMAAGEKPYILSHGSDRETYYIIMMKMPDDEIKSLESASGIKPTVIKMAGNNFVPLQLEADMKPGSVSETLYNSETGAWTATTALRSYKP
jgi:hypothetical protein